MEKWRFSTVRGKAQGDNFILTRDWDSNKRWVTQQPYWFAGNPFYSWIVAVDIGKYGQVTGVDAPATMK